MKHDSEKTFERALENLRQECQTFMKDFGDTHGVKLITLPESFEVTNLSSFVVQACEDVDDNQGVTFKIKAIPPQPVTKAITSPVKPQLVAAPVPTLSVPTTSFPVLDKVNKNEQSVNGVISSGGNRFSVLF